MLSAGASLTSATGTYMPSIWQKESPNWSLAISLRPGSCFQPVSLTSVGTLSVAPQRGQLNSVRSIAAAHQGQVVWRAAGAGGTSTGCARTEAGGGAGGVVGIAGAAGGPGCFTGPPHDRQKFAVSSICTPQFVQNMAYSVW